MHVFGATTCGPAHINQGLPNQDAWLRGEAGDLHVIAVSDGLGSRPHARTGAQAACHAVLDAVRQWRRHPQAPFDVLLGLVHLLWRARIAPLNPEDCACTCLMAALRSDGSGFAAQLGDGLVLLHTDEYTRALGRRDENDFANETLALGQTRRLSAWHQVRLSSGERTIILCTDGVADDLLPERLASFASWLRDEIAPIPPRRRWQTLRGQLIAWPTPHHLDNKTIAVIQTPRRTL